MLRVLIPLLFASLASGEKQPVTIGVAADPPGSSESLSDFVWAPDGRSFTFLKQKAIWVYDVAARRQRQVTRLSSLEAAAVKRPAVREPFAWENRRVKERTSQWTPDGRALVVLAGGDLFLWPLDSGKWQQLTATAEAERDPKLSPDGRLVSFQRGNELHVLDLQTRAVRQLTHDSTHTIWNGRVDWVYPEELDLGTAHWWSPDSSRIAFLQFDVGRQLVYPHADLLGREPVYEPQRYPMAGTPNADVRLGVVDAGGGKVSWMNLGDPRDALIARVTWLPDSKRLAVQRLNRVQNELRLLFADASTGATRTVLTESSPHWVNVSDDLRFWRRGDRFLWSSEESGYRHLYLYSSDGKRLKQLTEGDWEVKSVAGLDEERGLVYYLSTERNVLGRDLYTVSLDGGARRVVTPSKGTHAVKLSPDAKHYIDSFSSLTEPARKTLHSIDGSPVDVLQPAAAAAGEYEYLRPEIVEVKAAGGALLYARLLRPSNFDAARKYPAIVSVYGGPHAQNVCDCYGGLNWEQALAQRGFVVWQLDNRGTAGRGLAWEAKLYRRFGKQELADQQTGIEHLVGMGFVDPKRIGMHGWSYGGFLTLYSMLNAPGLVRAGIAGAAVTDWRNYDTIYTERYLGLPQDNEEGYRASSPVHQAANLEAPLLLIHNLGDDNVLFQNAMQMMVALQKAGKQYDLLIYPQKSHGVTGPERKHMLEAMTAFFERHLGSR